MFSLRRRNALEIFEGESKKVSRGKNAALRDTRKKARLDALHGRIANANIKRIVETDQLQAVVRDLQRQLGTALGAVAIYEKFMQELERDGNDPA